MNRIIAAIDQEIVELDAKAAKLRMLRQAALAIEEGEGDALIEGSPHELPQAEPIEEPRPTPARKPRRRRAVHSSKPAEIGPRGGQERRSAAQRDGRAKKHSDTRNRVLAFVRANPGKMGKEIADALGVDQSTVSAHIRPLCSDGTLRSEPAGGRGGGKAYFPRESVIAPPDDTGCRTDVERRVVGTLRDAPVALTASEVGLNAKTGAASATILRGLERRGVVEMIKDGDGAVARWTLAASMAEAA